MLRLRKNRGDYSPSLPGFSSLVTVRISMGRGSCYLWSGGIGMRLTGKNLPQALQPGDEVCSEVEMAR
jgi:hypothetical protein